MALSSLASLLLQKHSFNAEGRLMNTCYYIGLGGLFGILTVLFHVGASRRGGMVIFADHVYVDERDKQVT